MAAGNMVSVSSSAEDGEVCIWESPSASMESGCKHKVKPSSVLESVDLPDMLTAVTSACKSVSRWRGKMGDDKLAFGVAASPSR